MRKIILLLVPAAILTVILAIIAPRYFPYHVMAERISVPDAQCLSALFTGDLNGDGCSEIITIHNCLDLISLAISTGNTSSVPQLPDLNWYIIDEYADERLFNGQQNSSRSSSIGISGLLDSDGDGCDELFVQYRNARRIDLFLHPANPEQGRPIFEIAREGATNKWDPGLAVVGAFNDPDASGRLVIARATSAWGLRPRGILSFAADGSSGIRRQYPMGAYPTTVDVIDVYGDHLPEVFVSTDTPDNGCSINGTNDSTTYVIALDHNLRERWKAELGIKGYSWAYVCTEEKGTNPRLLAFVRYENASDSAAIHLLDPLDGTELAREEPEDLPNGAVPFIDRASGRRGVITGSLNGGRGSRYELIDGKLKVSHSEKFSKGRLGVFPLGDIVGDDSPEIGMMNGEDGSCWVIGQDLEPLLRIDRDGEESSISDVHVLYLADGKPRLIYVNAGAIAVAQVVRASRIAYYAQAYWGLAVYLLAAAAFLIYDKYTRPSRRDGEIRLLEHLRVSASHDNLSIVSHLERLAQAVRSVAAEKGQNAYSLNYMKGLLRVRAAKWNWDLESIVSIGRAHGLYRDEIRRAGAGARMLKRLLDPLEQDMRQGRKLDLAGFTDLAGKVEQAKGDIEKALKAIRLDLEPKLKCDLSDALSLALDVFRPAFAEKNITCAIAVPGPMPVRIPEEILLTILDNLISNAIQALDGAPQKRIAIRAESKDKKIECIIEDTGYGIPQELQADVFDMGVSTKGTGGTGLWYTRKALERFGGSVRLESEGRGKGARFIVSLPRLNPAP